ncbi:MAG: restriction endonuclease subunit S [Bacteroidales bacterium]|nr:restriction endonuclease subunit S [Bacteroidales bacterium]
MMEGWKEIALNEIGWFKGAGVNKLINTDEQPVYLVNYMDVYKHWRIYYNTNYQEVTAKDREIKEANLLEGDVLFTPSSEKPIDIGHAGVVMETMPNCVYSYHLIRLRLYDKTQFDLKYLSYLLNSDNVQKHFVSRASGSGIRYTLSLSDFKSAKIRFPKKSEQSAIAAILSKVDEAIASVQASISAAERLKKSLMQNLLTGRMKPDGTLRKEDEFYVDEKFGRVPKGWGVKKVTEVADYVQYGLNQASSEKGKIPMLRMNNIVKGKMTNAPLVYVELNDSLLQQYKLEKGDILFNRTNSLDLVGKVGVFELDGDYVFASYLIKVKVSKDNNPYFVNYALNSYPIQCSLRSKATPAVSQANINSKSLRNTSIIIPTNKKEQDEIVSRINNVENEIINKQNKIAVLERLKKSLMQNLLTGRVRINKE